MGGSRAQADQLLREFAAWRARHPKLSGVSVDEWWAERVQLGLYLHGDSNWTQSVYRLRAGDAAGLNADADWAAALNTPATIFRDYIFRVRFGMVETSGNSNNANFTIQYRIDTGGGFGAWTAVTTGTPIRPALSAQYADADATTRLITTGGTFSAGDGNEDASTGNINAANIVTEYEFALTMNSAQVALNDVIELRLVWNGVGLVSTYTNTPSITAGTLPPSPTLVQANFRGRTVNANNAVANAAFDASDPALNANFTVDSDKIFRLRFEIEETAGVSLSDGYKLQVRYDQAGGTNWTAWADVGFWEQIQANRNGPEDSPRVGSTQLEGATDGEATTNLISGAASGFVAGEVRETLTTGTIALNGQHTELDWGIWIAKLFSVDGTNGDENADGSTWQFRVVRDDGTVLTTYTNTPTITLNHASGHIGGQMIESPGRSVLEDGNGNLYTLVEASDQSTAPVMMKSTDDGVSWSMIDNANAPNNGDCEAVDMVMVNNVIHIAHNPGDVVFYYTFHTSAAASNPDTWQLSETVATGYTGNLEQAVALEVNSSDPNEVIVFYDTGGEALGFKRRSSAGTWDGSPTDLDATGGTDHSQVVTTKKTDASNDQVAVFYKDQTNNDLYLKTIGVASGTLSGSTQVETDLQDTGSGNHQSIMGAGYYSDGGTDKAVVYYNEATGANAEIRIISDPWGTPSVGGPVAASDAAIHQNAKDSRQSPGSIVIDGTDIWAFWVDGTSEDLLYAKSANGAAFDTPTTLITGSVHWAQTVLGTGEIFVVYLDYLYTDYAETGPLTIGNGHIESTSVTVGAAAISRRVGYVAPYVDPASADCVFDVSGIDIQEGDWIGVFISHETGDPTGFSFTPASGFTAITSLHSQPEVNHISQGFEKIATASEPSSYTFTASTSNQMLAILVVYRGVNGIDDITSWADANQVNPSQSVTPVADGDVLFWVMAYEPGVGGVESWSSDDGMIEIFQDNPKLQLAAYEEDAGAAGTYTRTFTYTGTNDDSSGMFIALANYIGLIGAGAAAAQGAGTVESGPDLSGAGAASASGAATLSTGATVDLNGFGNAASSGLGALRELNSMAGTGQAASSGLGVLRELNSMVGAGAASSSGTATLRSQNDLTGAGAAASSGAATLRSQNDLSGAGAAASSGAATLRELNSMVGAGQAASAGAGDLSVIGAVSLVGAGHAASSGLGILRGQNDISGAGAAASSGASTLTVGGVVGLVGAGHAASAGAAVLRSTDRLIGAGHAASSGAAVLRSTDRLIGAGHAASSGNAVLRSDVELVGAGQAASSGLGQLGTQGVVTFNGAGRASSSGAATLRGQNDLSGAGAASSSGAAVLRSTDRLIGAGHAASSGNAVLRSDVELAGAGHAASSGLGQIANEGVVNLNGAGHTCGQGAGVLSTLKNLSGAGHAASSGQATLRSTDRLSGAGHAASSGSAVLTSGATVTLAGAGHAASVGAGSLTRFVGLFGAGHASGQGSASGEFVAGLMGAGHAAAQGYAVLTRLIDMVGVGGATANGFARPPEGPETPTIFTGSEVRVVAGTGVIISRPGTSVRGRKP